MESQSKLPDIEARTSQLSLQNGEKSVVDKENMPPAGFPAEDESVTQIVKSMAQPAPASQHDDVVEGDDDDARSVATSTMSTTTSGGTKKKKKKKPKSKRGIV